MMDLLGAYTLKNLEMRVLTYGYHVSPDTHAKIDDDCLHVLENCIDEWLGLEHCFHSCCRYLDDGIQVILLTSLSFWINIDDFSLLDL